MNTKILSFFIFFATIFFTTKPAQTHSNDLDYNEIIKEWVKKNENATESKFWLFY